MYYRCRRADPDSRVDAQWNTYHLQTSLEIWDSVAHTLEQIGEKHGWPHGNFAEFTSIVAYLKATTGNKALFDEYLIARGLYDNAHEDEFPISMVEDLCKMVEPLVEKLQKADRQVDAGALPPNGATSPSEYGAMVEEEWAARRRAEPTKFELQAENKRLRKTILEMHEESERWRRLHFDLAGHRPSDWQDRPPPLT